MKKKYLNAAMQQSAAEFYAEEVAKTNMHAMVENSEKRYAVNTGCRKHLKNFCLALLHKMINIEVCQHPCNTCISN